MKWILIIFPLPALRMSLFWTDVFMKLVVAWYLWGYYPLVELLKQIKSYRSYSRVEGCLLCMNPHIFSFMKEGQKPRWNILFKNPAEHPHPKQSERDILLPSHAENRSLKLDKQPTGRLRMRKSSFSKCGEQPVWTKNEVKESAQEHLRELRKRKGDSWGRFN